LYAKRKGSFLLPVPGKNLGRDALRGLIVRLCTWQPLTGEQLATLLKKNVIICVTSILRQ
jgi:hypothetical protein